MRTKQLAEKHFDNFLELKWYQRMTQTDKFDHYDRHNERVIFVFQSTRREYSF